MIKLDQAWILPTVRAGHFHYRVLKPKLKVVALKLFKWLSLYHKVSIFLHIFGTKQRASSKAVTIFLATTVSIELKNYFNRTVSLFTVCQGCANFDSSKDLSNQMEIFLLVVQNFKLCQAAQLNKLFGKRYQAISFTSGRIKINLWILGIFDNTIRVNNIREWGTSQIFTLEINFKC